MQGTSSVRPALDLLYSKKSKHTTGDKADEKETHLRKKVFVSDSSGREAWEPNAFAAGKINQGG